MLDSGFAPAIEEILATTPPDTRQMALFSATMPDWIAKIRQKFLKNPVNITIVPATGEQSTIEQIAYQVPQEHKMAALCTLLHSAEGESSLIFSRTKFGVERLGKQLSRLGFTVGTLHGNKSQHAREEVLTAFRRGQVHTLLATNVAARGLDIQGIYQVINYELPESSELFMHRIGRTGRMGRQGKAITLLIPSDVPKWRRMASSLGQAVALQRLTIGQEAIGTILGAQQEASSITQEYEQNSEQPLVHGRNHFTRGQERSRRALPKPEGHLASGMERRQQESDANRIPTHTPAWQSEGFPLPEDPYSDKLRDGRRGARKQSSFKKSPEKPKAHSFATTVPPHQAARRKSRATPTERTASHRSAHALRPK